MNFIRLFVRGLFKRRLPGPRLFSRFQTIVFVAFVPVWCFIFKLIRLDETDNNYPYQIYLFPFFYIFFLLSCYVYAFFINDPYRSALPFTGRVPFLNAVVHALFFSLAIFLLTNGGKNF